MNVKILLFKVVMSKKSGLKSQFFLSNFSIKFIRMLFKSFLKTLLFDKEKDSDRSRSNRNILNMVHYKESTTYFYKTIEGFLGQSLMMSVSPYPLLYVLSSLFFN